MRVVLVGDARDRARVRQSLALSQIEIVGEAPTLAVARAIGRDVDAFIVATAPARREVRDVEALTPRELDVLQVLAEGLSNKAIARRLGISDQTVKFHVASIAGKLGAQNRTEAVRIAIQRGLIEL
ncbi:MAG TPA: response regulator transcription factor [Vicinamibacterales bacterium]|jgi:DNA-binding NarL/FixJ family response regulator|nr:response regulator transcription factor [Vicinamibacterales bacterium]